MKPPPADIKDALREIVDGRIVKRVRHELRWEGRDLTPAFIEILEEAGYRPRLVRDIEVRPGERVPAFYVDEAVAYFGWVFWEKFTQLKLRKLYGSVVRNDKGDWAIQIPPTRNKVVYANENLKAEMDIEMPSGF